VAARLARGLDETITVVSVYPSGADIAVDVRGLAEVERGEGPPDVGDVSALVEKVRSALKRIEGQFSHLRPRGEITSASLLGEHQFYFIIQEQLRQLRRRLRDIEEVQEHERRPSQGAPSLPVRLMSRGLVGKGKVIEERAGRSSVLAEMAAAQEIQLYLQDLAEKAVPLASVGPAGLLRLVRHTALLQLLAEAGAGPEEQIVLHVGSSGPAGARWAKGLADIYQAYGLTEDLSLEGAAPEAPWWRLEVTRLPEEDGSAGHALLIKGLAAGRLASGEVGSHLFCPTHEGLVPIQVHAWPVPEGADGRAVLEEHLAARRRWLEELARAAEVSGDPLPLLPVVRIYNEGGSTFDLRTGMVLETVPPAYPFVMAGLALPPELREDR
jgi:hypothetical protein